MEKKKTMYGEALRMIGQGCLDLGKSMWGTVFNHPAGSALVVSMVANVWMFVSMGEARAERDAYNEEVVIGEGKLDSLSMLVPHWDKKDTAKKGCEQGNGNVKSNK